MQNNIATGGGLNFASGPAANVKVCGKNNG